MEDKVFYFCTLLGHRWLTCDVEMTEEQPRAALDLTHILCSYVLFPIPILNLTLSQR